MIVCNLLQKTLSVAEIAVLTNNLTKYVLIRHFAYIYIIIYIICENFLFHNKISYEFTNKANGDWRISEKS